MARITPLYITVETNAGAEVGPVRILAADKIAAEATCRRQNWPYEDSPKVHLLMGFYALRRTGQADAPDFDAFMADVADYVIARTLDNPADADAAGEEGPTTAGSGF